jgi:hypothetical protein
LHQTREDSPRDASTLPAAEGSLGAEVTGWWLTARAGSPDRTAGEDMTGTTISAVDLSTDARTDAPRIVEDTTADPRLARSRRTAVAALLAVLVVLGVAAGIAYRVNQPAPAAPTTGDARTTTGDAAESAHGIRGGLATGTAIVLHPIAAVATGGGSDRSQLAHGGPGSVVVGR